MAPNTFITALPVSLMLLLLGACTTIPVGERNQIRDEVNQAAETTIAQLVALDPSIQEALDQATGYAVASVSATKIPIVGAGYGLALLHDLENKTRTYINVSRFDLGAGVGAGRFRVLVIFENRDTLERFRDGTWQSVVGTQTTAGSQGGSRTVRSGDGYAIYFVSDTGVALVASARLIKTSVNEDLTSASSLKHCTNY